MNTLLDLFLFESVSSLEEETTDVLVRQCAGPGADGDDGPELAMT